ncbi:hypothetical protein GGI43DRAFT_431831 [Trichoderma evansii]
MPYSMNVLIEFSAASLAEHSVTPIDPRLKGSDGTTDFVTLEKLGNILLRDAVETAYRSKISLWRLLDLGISKPSARYRLLHGGAVRFKIITYNEEKPFVLKDRKVQFASFWHPRATHAEDWVISVAAPACWTGVSSEFALFNADVVSPSSGPAARWDTGYARGFLLDAISDGIPRSATLIGAHGSSEIGLGTQDSLAHIAELAGVLYPDPKTLGQHKWCHEGYV